MASQLADPAKITHVHRLLIEAATGSVALSLDELGEYAGITNYVAAMCANLMKARRYDTKEWSESVTPFLSAFLTMEQAETIFAAFYQRCGKEDPDAAASFMVEEDSGVDLCNTEFSLAFGGKILLHDTRLWLKRGHRYGLLGPNGAGKTTLMKNIANGHLEGLPADIKTVYVQHGASSRRKPSCQIVPPLC